jgi:N-acetylglucosaminyldiphosphoundecaprenol N-acetyl-beta-D-mannosaminyltransferase
MKKDHKQIEQLEKRLTGGSGRNVSVGFKKLCFKGFGFVSLLIAEIFQWILGFILFISCSVPILFILILRKIIFRKDIFIRRDVFGQFGRPAMIRYFNLENYILSNAFLFFHVLTFDLLLIGVSIKDYKPDNREIGDAALYEKKPGVFNLWFLRSSSRIAHDGRTKIELEYSFRRSFFGDFMLILKSIPAAFFHVDAKDYSEDINLLGVNFHNLTMKDAISRVTDDIEAGRRKKAYFVNPDCFNKTFNDKKYFEVLQRADYIFPDGIGVLIACKMIRNPLKENVNGTDMLPFICDVSVKKGFSIFLLGGKPGVAAEMKKRLEETYPGVRITGEQNGYFDREKETSNVIKRINEVNPDILLVAFGAPLQEIWIDEHFDKLSCRIIMGVGGLFDFYSGNIRRAPKWMREVGLEWVFRFMMEPMRMFRRYMIGNPLFIMRVLRWRKREAAREKNE